MEAYGSRLNSEPISSLRLDKDSEGMVVKEDCFGKLPGFCLQIFSCLLGCPEGKKTEFITSLLDALTTDMVQAINSAVPTGGGR